MALFDDIDEVGSNDIDVNPITLEEAIELTEVQGEVVLAIEDADKWVGKLVQAKDTVEKIEERIAFEEEVFTQYEYNEAANILSFEELRIKADEVGVDLEEITLEAEEKEEKKDEPKTKGKFSKIIDKILNYIKTIVAKAIGAISKLSIKIRKYLDGKSKVAAKYLKDLNDKKGEPKEFSENQIKSIRNQLCAVGKTISPKTITSLMSNNYRTQLSSKLNDYVESIDGGDDLSTLNFAKMVSVDTKLQSKSKEKLRTKLSTHSEFEGTTTGETVTAYIVGHDGKAVDWTSYTITSKQFKDLYKDAKVTTPKRAEIKKALVSIYATSKKITKDDTVSEKTLKHIEELTKTYKSSDKPDEQVVNNLNNVTSLAIKFNLDELKAIQKLNAKVLWVCKLAIDNIDVESKKEEDKKD